MYLTRVMPSYTREQPRHKVRAAWNHPPAQALQLHLLPLLKLFITLSSQLTKVHTNCVPGPMPERRNTVTAKCESDLKKPGA